LLHDTLAADSGGHIVKSKVIIVALLLSMALTVNRSFAASDDAGSAVVILADDAGVGFNRYTPTPNIAALASAGTRFSHGYALQECSPSRSTLLTSHNSAEWGHAQNPARPIPPAIPVWPREVRRGGIATAFIGKWHHVEITPYGAGFGSAPLWFIGGGSSYYGDALLRRENKPAGTVPGHLTAAFAAEAVRWIKKQNGRFFLYLAPNAVHQPDEPSYAELVRGLDRLVRDVRAAVPAGTLLIFASDNGCDTGKQPECSNLPFSGGKSRLTEGGVRIPFSMTWPGRVAKTVNSTPVTLQDIGPTVLDALGLAVAANLKGASLLRPLSRNRALVFGSKAKGTIRRGDYKLNERGQLFNIVADPGEKLPLVMPALKAELQALRSSIVKNWLDPAS
jgi:arylsulfatase A-like enzyme